MSLSDPDEEATGGCSLFGESVLQTSCPPALRSLCSKKLGRTCRSFMNSFFASSGAQSELSTLERRWLEWLAQSLLFESNAHHTARVEETL